MLHAHFSSRLPSPIEGEPAAEAQGFCAVGVPDPAELSLLNPDITPPIP